MDSNVSSAVGRSIGLTLEELQTDGQRRILDNIEKTRKCGLEGIISLPQIVVCGDQSAGKSSLLEALTEIPFPRNDNLCTRFATEISLRRAATEQFIIKVIPDNARPSEEQERIKAFSEPMADLKDLPAVMGAAIEVMGIAGSNQAAGSAFAKDTLSLEISGPERPHLTLVDIPGLIQASTKGVSRADVAMVAEITDHYISQPRTICLAVISATNDAANQPILDRVRTFDPEGERSLGVITKPDKLSAGSGSEAKFLELAQNEDVFFKLGWHVIKNRTFEESHVSFKKRNSLEKAYFRSSNFKILPKDTVGIESLRIRLSQLLFEHAKNELPRLKGELEDTLKQAKSELIGLGEPRSNLEECRCYLTQLNLNCHEICKAALQGHYQHPYFKAGTDEAFSVKSKGTIARLRASIQFVNNEFAEKLRVNGHKYNIDFGVPESKPFPKDGPQILVKKAALDWVRQMLLRSRGRELVGNFNPNLIAEMFWEQSQPWEEHASAHIDHVLQLCEMFMSNLLDHLAAKDVKSKIWSGIVQDSLKARRLKAFDELKKLIQDSKDFPINYNHYYTDTIHRHRHKRLKTQVQVEVTPGTPSSHRCSLGDHYHRPNISGIIDKVVANLENSTTADMEKSSCEEALDCLLAIYKVQQKTFIANVVTQVIERHIIRGLEMILSPLAVVHMSDTKVEAIASEPDATKRHRRLLTDRIKKLEAGQEIFRDSMGVM